MSSYLPLIFVSYLTVISYLRQVKGRKNLFCYLCLLICECWWMRKSWFECCLGRKVSLIMIVGLYSLFTALRIYDFHISTIIYNRYSSLGWFIWTQHNDQLPVGLLAQLVERRYRRGHVFTIPHVPEFFSGLISTTSWIVFIAARISYIRFFTGVHIIWFSYI